MKENWDKAINFVIEWEKYWSSNPDDPGGLTIWGINSRDWPEEVAKMRKMAKSDALVYAKDFYKKEYWDKCGCDNLPQPMDIFIFDASVNCGVRNALKWWGEAKEPHIYLFRRLEYYVSLKSLFPTNGRGWVRRVLELRWYVESEQK